MARIPVAVWSGTFRIMGIELRCHTLSDGRRVIESEGVEAMFRMIEDGWAPPTSEHLGYLSDPDVIAFARWQAGVDGQ
jgi:hypothetical protein